MQVITKTREGIRSPGHETTDNCKVWVLRTELVSSTGAACTLNHYAISSLLVSQYILPTAPVKPPSPLPVFGLDSN